MKLRTLIGLPLIAVGLLHVAPAHAQEASPDPRMGLAAGVHDAGMAAHNMELVAHVPKPDDFVAQGDAPSFLFVNSDLAFQGNRVFVGNDAGFMVYDISDPANPELVSSVVCPGGQGDPSVGAERPYRLRLGTAGHGGQSGSVPRGADLGHQRYREPRAGSGGPDVPWFAHAYGCHGSDRR
ncbi:MAG: hypothetical protein P8Y29_01815 [Gemmatimonadota bacterium]